MTVQLTTIRPEDDPANWFTAQEVVGPAIVTAVTRGHWQLYDRVPDPKQFVRPVGELCSELNALHKFFVPPGHLLRVHSGDRGNPAYLISGYRLPAR